ncbi:class I SAM-dependent methyltransferase [Bradyrhizobium septentrionale]|uniref:SAM-dependent methyltransferase n=1 Tax=Bradyrhizobium septentrionale TaxID=1404411 RepID=A0A973W1L5_9BRAD|nr:rRNA adenine N-6-methyltransferase family protein [Bradyrhizobium septentrionale]UGY14700.1 SAM-dependent methyltransferase [Bradyrhizobium septentrionale]UGY23275.1 SAM-dependent methyltransferase [Bradyrhizobium septentrionale]
MSHDLISFLTAWMAAPGRVGAIAPSGAALAELITRDISANTGPILELGPGTGAFTYQLLKRGVRQQDLTLIEYGSDFMRLLQLRFPGARVLWMDAARLASERLYDGAPVGAVVSGLPLLNMSPRKVISIVGGAFSYMRPGGAFYQFTYGMRCPVRRPILDRLGLRATLVDRAILNVPPAAVYRLTRRPQYRLITRDAAPAADAGISPITKQRRANEAAPA